MKKVFLFILCAFIFAITASAVRIDTKIEDSNKNLYLPDDDGVFYLPSHIDKTNVKFVFPVDGNIEYYLPTGATKSVKSGESIDVRVYEAKDTLGNINYKIRFVCDGTTYSYILYFADNLPSVYVKTSNGETNLINNQVKDENTKISIVNKNGTFEYHDTSGTYSEIKVRGNTTKDYAKVPFKIKLYSKERLFGMSNGKSWILLANYLDQSLLRNSVMYYLGGQMGMIAPKFQSVDLYIDGHYYGIYLLCEKVQIGEDRVDIFDLEKSTDLLNASYKPFSTVVTSGELIDNTILKEYRYIDGITDPEDITGGYLIELDNSYYRNEKCYFVTQNDNHYVIKSPENASKRQVEYIAELFARMEEAIYSDNGYNSIGKYYTEYADIDSFAVAYLMAEYGRNYDAGSSSMYFYKDRDINGIQSKIYKGPLWDCDNTLGNILKGGAAKQDGFWARDRRLWIGLTSHDDFNLIVKQKFEQMYDIVYDMSDCGGIIDTWISELGTSIVMEQMRNKTADYKTWPLYKDGIHYDRWQSSQTFNFSDNYSDKINATSETVIGYLLECMTKRADWIARALDCNVTLRTRVIADPSPNPPIDDTSEVTDITDTQQTDIDSTSDTYTTTDETMYETTEETSYNSQESQSDDSYSDEEKETYKDKDNLDIKPILIIVIIVAVFIGVITALIVKNNKHDK